MPHLNTVAVNLHGICEPIKREAKPGMAGSEGNPELEFDPWPGDGQSHLVLVQAEINSVMKLTKTSYNQGDTWYIVRHLFPNLIQLIWGFQTCLY